MEQRNKNIDIIKAIACICVVHIHYSFPGKFGIYLSAINRFGVPYFFFVSGYFFCKNNDITLKRIFFKIFHLFNLIFHSGLFYFVFHIIFNNILYHYNWNIGKYTLKILTKGKIIKFLISNDPFIYSHLWFLLALLYIYILLFILQIINNSLINNSFLIYLLIYIGLVGYIILSEFSGLKLFKTIYKIKNTNYCIIISNIFFFRALPFFMLGIIAKKKIINLKLKINICLFIFFIGASLVSLEFYIIKKSLIIYLCTLIQIISLIFISISNNQPNNLKFISYIGSNLSDKIYIYHIAIGEISNLINIRLSLINKNVYKNIKFIIIILSTLFFCSFIENIKMKIKK